MKNGTYQSVDRFNNKFYRKSDRVSNFWQSVQGLIPSAKALLGNL